MDGNSTESGEYDLRFSGAKVVLPEAGLTKIDICIKDGTIAALVPAEDSARAAEVVDVSGKVILPGAIDAHVHLGKNIAAPEEPIDASAESASAAAGGITSMLVYLIGPDPYGESFRKSVDIMNAHSHTDYGFHFCIVTREQLEELPGYVSDLGVSSFKFFMNFRGDEGAYLGVPGIDDSFMYDLLTKGAESGALINAHPENVEIIWRLRGDIPQDPDAGLRQWYDTRPPFVEAEAAQSAAYFAKVLGASLYTVHVSSRETLDALKRQRQAYDNVFIETCPHYLTLDYDTPMGSRAKVNPPIRTADDQEALWEGVRDGSIDTIGSDHNSRHFSRKDTDIWSASAGFPGVGTLLPTMISEGHVKRGIPLERIAELTSSRPAQLFGMYPKKGAIAVGSDADLTVVDLNSSFTVAAADQHSAAEYSVWEGTRLECRITDTVIRGRFALRAGELQDAFGTYLPRPRSGEAALLAL